MPSTAIDIALVVALVFTCGFSFAMLQEFRRFKAHAGEYGEALREASRAMEQIDAALSRTHEEGARTALSLGERLETAERMLGKLKTAEAAATAQLVRLRDRIEEARDAVAETEASPRTDGGGRAAPDKIRTGKGSAGKGVTGKTCASQNAASKNAASRNATSKNPTSNSRSRPCATPSLQSPGAEIVATPAAPAPDTHNLALAPAEDTAQDAPRTRKILSWPVVRNARIAAGC